MTKLPNELSLADAALFYAALGWPVFPLIPKNKRPLTAHGFKDSSIVARQINQWWTAQPDANIGLDCGAAKLVVIDVDAQADGLSAWTRLNPGVATLTSNTGGGGLHVFYRAPDGLSITNSASRLAPGIDVRAAGGYVVLPPSHHPTGNRYLWNNWRDIADLPPALAERLTAEATPHSAINNQESTINNLPSSVVGQPSPYAAAALTAENAAVRQSPVGQRNANLFRAAFNLGQLVGSDQLTQAQVETSLTESARLTGLTDDEIRRTIASGLKAGFAKPRQVPTANGRRQTADGRRQTAAEASHPATETDKPPSAVNRQPSIQYLVEDGRLVSKIVTAHGLVTRTLGNFDARLVSVLTIDDGEDKKKQYTLTGRTDDNIILPEARVDALDFKRLDWVEQHWGPDAIVMPGHSANDNLSAAIRFLSRGQFQRRDVFVHTGWRWIDKRPIFLTANGVIQATAIEADQLPSPVAYSANGLLRRTTEGGGVGGGGRPPSVSVELEREIERYRLPSPPDTREAEAEAMRASLRFLEVAPTHVTIPLWTSMYLAPCAEFAAPRFALWLYGVTGTLKSTLAALALSHWGDWTADDLIGWNSTANALGKLLFAAKDMPFVIDDFAPQTDHLAAAKLEAAAAVIIRDSGNRTGRARMNSDRSLAAVYRPRGLLISTGEQLPDNPSILARLITVEIRSGDVKLDLLTREQANRARYAEAMAGYVMHLSRQYPDLMRTARIEAKAYSDELRAAGHHLRIPDGLGLLHSGFVRAIHYAETIGALSAGEAADWRSEGWRVMLLLGKKQAEIVAAERPTLRFLLILADLLTQGKLRLEPLRGDTPSPASELCAAGEGRGGGILGSPDGLLIGWYDADFYYLLPSAAYNTIAKFARDEGRHFGIKEHALRKALAEEGILETAEGRSTLRLSVNNQQQRLLWLRRAAVEKVWGIA